MKVAIIGGGAAGFFAAIHVKENYPNAQVSILEKSTKVLSKVKISGGGRCNVTNGCQSISQLVKAYPRGAKLLKKAFQQFDNHDTMQWFEQRKVPLTTQEDLCVFPVSQDSQSIIDVFLKECRRLHIAIKTQHPVQQIKAIDSGFELRFGKGIPPQNFDKLIVATGGAPKRSMLQWLEDLGHNIEEPVPSLFTFNMPSEPIKELMGIVIEDAQVKIQGTKLKAQGPLLITHWGMSGPAILVLSAFGARVLHNMNYQGTALVNWVNGMNFEQVAECLQQISSKHPKKKITNNRPFNLPDRLWKFFLNKCDISFDKPWGELGKKGINKLTTILCNDSFNVQGKTTFKEEFVTCGGVSLQSIHTHTMESKAHPGLFFAGEVLDIDGITGGFNFQAAWTTAYIAAQLGEIN